MGQNSSYNVSNPSSINSSAASSRTPSVASSRTPSVAAMPTTGLVFYVDLLSQPARAITLLAKALDLEYTEKQIDMVKGENKSEAYMKIHPFGTIPAVVDGDLTIIESCTALRYIASKYDTSGKWYPEDLVTRVRVDEFLDWHVDTIRKHGIGYFVNLVLYPVMKNQEPDMPLINGHKDDLKKAEDNMVKYFLNGRDFIAGDHVTIADIKAVTELEQPMVAGVTFGKPIMDYYDRVIAQLSPNYDQVTEKLRTATKSLLNK